jgi:DNA-binding NtrC family response regulator
MLLAILLAGDCPKTKMKNSLSRVNVFKPVAGKEFQVTMQQTIHKTHHKHTLQNSRGEQALSGKITELKNNAYMLLQEIRELSKLEFTDIQRGIDLYEEVRGFEMKLIRLALQETDGHQVRAADLLGIKMTTLNEKIKRYGIDPYDPTDSVISDTANR